MTLAERKAGLRRCEKCGACLIAVPQFSVCSNVPTGSNEGCQSKLQPRLSVMDRNRWWAYILIKVGMPEAIKVAGAGNAEPRDKCCRWGLYKIGDKWYQRLKRLNMVNEKLGDVIAIGGYQRGAFRPF